MRTSEMRTEPGILSRDKAKPCPFCGKQPEIDWLTDGKVREVVISCTNSDCFAMPIVMGRKRKQGLDRWNKRGKK